MKIILALLLACHFVQATTLDEYIIQHGECVTEGHLFFTNTLQHPTQQPQYFINLLASHPHIKTIGEIGFNAGHSSELFLKTCPNAHIYSFDIMTHSYAFLGKEYIDLNYPKRHHLITSDSQKTISEYALINRDLKFDLIFLDGGHFYTNIINDIINMKAFAHPDTILVIDDLCIPEIKKAWNDCVKANLITEGMVIQSKHKIWTQCHYIFTQ